MRVGVVARLEVLDAPDALDALAPLLLFDAPAVLAVRVARFLDVAPALDVALRFLDVPPAPDVAPRFLDADPDLDVAALVLPTLLARLPPVLDARVFVPVR